MKITIQYTEDEEMISAHCLRDEIQKMIPESEIKVLNPQGDEEPKD